MTIPHGNADLAHNPIIEDFRAALASQGEITLTVHVIPRAKTTTIKDVFENGVIKISISKPADKGKANAELIYFLAHLFDVPQVAVDIVRGHTSRLKTLRITTSL